MSRVEVNAEAIPEELKERDQWLLWDRSNETPRRPHWRGDFGVSWSDPAAWHSFEDAHAAAQAEESWGVGYVTAADNDGHARGVYGVIDIDGAAKEVFDAEAIPCSDCGAEAYKGREVAREEFTKDALEDAPPATEAVEYYFCPDCGAEARVMRVDGDRREPEWDRGSPKISQQHLSEECETTDRPREWFPGLQTLVGEGGAYVEWSPSHGEPGPSGLHIPVWNIDVPDWWSDTAHPDLEHTGVDVLTNKFCTFTGDEEIAGDVVEHHAGVEEWLADAYEALTGETAPPRENATLPERTGAASGAAARDDDWMTEERAEEALRYIDAGCEYEQWRNIGFALADEFDDRTALRLFESWSRGSSKWDDEAERLAERIISDADEGAGRSIGTVVYHAQEGGWSPDVSADDGPPLWKQQVVANSDRYDDVGEVPDDPADLPRPGESDDSADEAAADSATGEDVGDEDSTPWADVRTLYATAQNEPEVPKGRARKAAASVLEQLTSWIHVEDGDELWVYDADSGTYNRSGKARAGEMLESSLGEYYSRSEKREIIDRIEERNHVKRSELNADDEDDPLLCVANGVVNLRTGDLLDHDPKYRFIRGLPWRFDPADADREAILSFLDSVTERTCDRDTLLDHLAHGLMPGHPYRAFVVCYGPGGNGKTQVAELFRGFVGRENAAAVEIDELAGDDFATGDLPGAFINWGDDMAGDGGGTLSDLSTLKKATGGSEIRANEKHEKTFDFKNEAAMFFSANEPPRIGEQKQSIADRIYPIEMPYRFKAPEDVDAGDPLEKEKTPNIAETMLSDDAAMRGLLALAVEHAQHLVENRGEYSQPESPSERQQKYQRQSDPIAKFAAEGLQPAGDDMKIRKDDAYRVFRSMAQAWDERPSSEQGFKRQLPAKFPAEVETAQSRALAMPDDETERVQCWKRVCWTDKAAKRMPDWLRERYADHFEDDEAADDTADDADTAADTGALDDLDAGRHDVTVTVAEKMDPKPWQQARGHVVDDEGNIMEFVAEGSTNPVSHVEEDDRVEISNAKAATDRDGILRLEISGVCDVTVTNRDADQSALDDTDGDDTAEAAADGGETAVAPDLPPEDVGGDRANARRLAYVLDGRASMRKQALMNEAANADAFDMSMAAAADAIEWSLREGGPISELPNGELST